MKYALGRPAVLTIVIVAIVTASGLLLRSSTGSAKAPPSPAADESSPKAAGTRIVAENPQASAAAGPGETPKPSQPAIAPNFSTATAGPKNVGDYRQLLETVGTLTAAHCYQSYLNISLLSDGRAKGIYTQKEAAQLLDSVLAILDSVDRKLATLSKIDLDRADHDSLEQMRDLSDLLHRQGRQLQTYWDSGKEADATQYEEVRKDSWAAISRLMGTGR
jgi:hypothetical protein